MGFSRHWLRDHTFILTRVSGTIDNRSLLEHVQALNRERDGVIGMKELADCRDLRDVEALSVSAVTQAGSIEVKKPGSRLVILVPKQSPVIYGLARAYQMFASESREAVIVSTDVDEALRWLEFDETRLQVIKDFILNESHAKPEGNPTRTMSSS